MYCNNCLSTFAAVAADPNIVGKSLSRPLDPVALVTHSVGYPVYLYNQFTKFCVKLYTKLVHEVNKTVYTIIDKETKKCDYIMNTEIIRNMLFINAL